MTNTAKDVVLKDVEFIIANSEEELKSLSGKNLLITGGAGFLGYYILQTLIHWNQMNKYGEKINIVVYDNFIRGMPYWLDSLKKNENLMLIKHDITNPLPEINIEFDYIIHAASIASPTYYRKYPLQTMDANVNGLRYLLDYSRSRIKSESPVEGFLFFSTSEIYGDPDPSFIPTPETYRGFVSSTGPRACYDESKRYGETLCVTFAKQFDLPVTIARPFNNYGPGLKITDRRVIPDFIRDILNNNDVVLLSDGSPSRTFCYIADAICGYFKILVNGKSGEPYNIGVSSPEISMKELAGKLVNIATDLKNYAGKVVYQQSPDKNYLVDNPNRRCPDISKAVSQLGYNPQIDLDDGLERNFIWYMEHNMAVEA
jgi:UDP-glucuronate decarboxylase